DFARKARVCQIAALIGVDESVGITFGLGDVTQGERKAAQRKVIAASSNRGAFVLGEVLLTLLQQQPSQRCPTLPAQARIEAYYQTIIYSVAVVGDLLEHRRSQRIRFDAGSLRQWPEVVTCCSKHGPDAAAAIIDAL